MPKIVDKKRILDMYSSGCSLKEIEDQTKYSRTTILKHLKLNDVWVSKGEKDKEIIRKYVDEGKSAIQVSKEVGLCKNTIAYRLRVNNIQTRTNEVDSEPIIGLYSSGLLTSEVARIVGCSTCTVTAKLKEAGITIDNHLLKIGDDELLEIYSSHKSLSKTAAHFKVSTSFIKKKLIKLGVKTFRSKTWDDSCVKEAIELYERGFSAQEIGKKFGFSHTTILTELKKLGIKIREKYTEAVRGDGYSKISNAQFGRIKASADVRELSFELDRDFLFELYMEQGEKCKLSGVDISLPSCYSDFVSGNFTASLDRIDSSVGYIETNVQWVHKSINIMKQAMDDRDFIRWCKIVSSFNP
jgi:DNA-binding CsgD family transcriptional regulator